MKTLSLILIAARAIAQDSLQPFKFSAYIEYYYCYDLAEPANHLRPAFFYNYNRHNEVNLNLAAEGPLQHIFDANAGLKLSGRSNLWIDAGVFPSHIGFESAIGADCWNLTRSILADNSPYYRQCTCQSRSTQVGRQRQYLLLQKPDELK